MAFSDEPLTQGVTAIKAVHLTEIRDAVNVARTAAELEPRTFTDASVAGTSVKAIHITELRTAVEDARSQRGLPPFEYTDGALSAGTIIKSVHIQEVREVCRRLIDGCPAISITNPSRTTFTVDTAMTATFQSDAAEGAAFSIAAGSLPAGLSLSASGLLTGAPSETGTFPFAVAAEDRYGCRGTSATYALSIVPPATISSFTGPPGSVGPGATVTLLGMFSGGTAVVTSDQGHSFVAVSGTEYEQTVTVTTVFTLTVTNAAGDPVETSLTVAVASISGRYAITPTIVYSCAFGSVDLNIGEFMFAASGSSLTAHGAPVAMTGSITGSSFAVSGIRQGSVNETYSLSGVFDATFTSWTGTFGVSFVGSGSLDCTNQTFTIAGDGL